MLKIAGMKFEF